MIASKIASVIDAALANSSIGLKELTKPNCAVVLDTFGNVSLRWLSTDRPDQFEDMVAFAIIQDLSSFKRLVKNLAEQVKTGNYAAAKAWFATMGRIEIDQVATQALGQMKASAAKALQESGDAQPFHRADLQGQGRATLVCPFSVPRALALASRSCHTLGGSMLNLQSKDGRSSLRINGDGANTWGQRSGLGIFSSNCSLTQDGNRCELKASFRRDELTVFANAIEALHAEIQQQSETSLWSVHGAVVLSFKWQSGGNIVAYCLFSDPAVEQGQRLFGRMFIDQSYLPELVATVKEAMDKVDHSSD